MDRSGRGGGGIVPTQEPPRLRAAQGTAPKPAVLSPSDRRVQGADDSARGPGGPSRRHSCRHSYSRVWRPAPQRTGPAGGSAYRRPLKRPRMRAAPAVWVRWTAGKRSTLRRRHSYRGVQLRAPGHLDRRHGQYAAPPALQPRSTTPRPGGAGPLACALRCAAGSGTCLRVRHWMPAESRRSTRHGIASKRNTLRHRTSRSRVWRPAPRRSAPLEGWHLADPGTPAVAGGAGYCAKARGPISLGSQSTRR
jgi:hypothetical protein